MTRARRQPGLRQLLLVLSAVMALCLSSCGSKSTPGSAASSSPSTTSSTVHLAKTKFVLHAGLAFGAFHHFIYKPLRAGELGHPFTHKLTAIKAALAAAFVYHELKLALADAQADPLLSKLVAPITSLENKIRTLRSGVGGGNPQATAITSANGSIGDIHALAAGAGHPITEQVPSALG